MITPDRIERFTERHPPTVSESTKTAARRTGKINESPETLRAYLENNGVTVTRVKNGSNGTKVLIVDGCPMNGEHGKQGDTAIILRPEGLIGFKCHHDGCSEYGWRDVRKKIDPDYDDVQLIVDI